TRLDNHRHNFYARCGFLLCYRAFRELHSFPTRRSSDLIYPWILMGIYKIGERFWPVSLYSTFLQVSRSSRQYQFLMLFLVMTIRSEEHTSELQSRENLVCRHLLQKKKHKITVRNSCGKR